MSMLHSVTTSANETLVPNDRRAAQELAESQQLAHVGSWELDIATGRVTWSAELHRIFGLEIGSVEPSYERYLACVHPEDAPRAEAAVDAILGGGEPVSMECRILRPDGSVRYVHEEKRREDRGVPFRLFGTVLDVTERVEAESAAQESLERLRRSDEDRRRLLARVVAAHEDERRLIAGMIHDDSIQVMAAVGIRLELLQRKAEGDEVKTAVQAVQTTVQKTIERLRLMMFELHPPALDRDGLVAGLRMFLERMREQTGLRFNLENRLIDEPPQRIRLALYRIAQEAITNVRKHAETDSVEVTADSVDDGMLLRVTDRGTGFLVQATGIEPDHLGLSAMREHAEMIGGRLIIRSRPQEGTTVEVFAPLRDAEARDD